MKDHPLVVQAKQRIKGAIASNDLVFNFSGGKDSHAIVGLLLEMIADKELSEEEISRVSVFHADTTIEYPLLVGLTHKSLEFFQQQGIKTVVASAPPEERFFAMLFGYGRPVPSKFVRWCTDNLKIRPSIKNSDAVHVTGEHLGESLSRDKKLKSSCGSSECGIDRLEKSTDGDRLLKPITEWSNCQVWDYLFWLDYSGVFYDGFFNRISHVYEIGNDDEKNTSLRMGCISCPVVSVHRAFNTDAKGVPTRLGLKLRLILEEMRSDDIRLKNPRAPKSGKVRQLGAISVYARRYYWPHIKQINQHLAEFNVCLISKEEEVFVDNSLEIGRYPKTYKSEQIMKLEMDWFKRCPD
ncbi:MAG: hypothetical protein KatS3mg087_0648 [Patescibacteria group bacterium]|nr:MAG: hypothetical protein KatS3mg087_0648 [Patescibacteria group bacterium]